MTSGFKIAVSDVTGRGCFLILWLVALAGCGANYVKKSAQEQLDQNQYEAALQTYEEGLRGHPENVALRAGYLRAKVAIFDRLITEATTARALGNQAQASDALRRALRLYPEDPRAKVLLLELERDSRRRAAVAEAIGLDAKGMKERAVLVIQSALKDNPDDAELLALQRRHELESREAELTNGRLAETRPVSLDFKDANLRTLLDVLTRNSSINFIMDKDVRPDLRTTVYLRDTRLEDALELLTATNQLAYKVLDNATVLIYPRSADKMKEYQDLVVRAFYLSNADVKQTAQMLKTMLRVRDPFVDEKLNMLMLRETPETIHLAERMIALQDVAEPEVLLDVQVLEIKRSALTELGINYPNSITLTPIAPPGGFTVGNVGGINSNRIGVTVPSLTLNLNRNVDNANMLANPQIRVRNKEKARVLIGDKLPLVTTTGSVTNGGFISESVQYVDVGLKLEVEPQIYLSEEVAIKVGLEVSSLVQAIRTAAGSLVYQIGNRSANTLLQLRDGETQLLAGLISQDERTSASRIPGIGDLPLVGRLFASQRDDVQRSEIVLAITPRIVRAIRRPDLNQTEFWSGTENVVRSRPLTLPSSLPGPGKPQEQPSAHRAEQVQESGPIAPIPVSLRLTAPPEVKVGDTFVMQVRLKADQAVRGLPVQLQFPSALLEIVDAEEGDFFRKNDAPTSASKSLDQAQGMASMAVLLSGADGIKGDGTAMTFRFKALAPGASEIRIVSAAPVSVDALPPINLPDPVKVVAQ